MTPTRPLAVRAHAPSGDPVSDHARMAYDALAEHYDFFTAHHDYDDWTATIERLARRHGLDGTRLLDLACGTGKSFMPFLRRGYEVVACDVSEAMLQCAKKKAGEEAALHVADVRALPRFGSFDLVTCLDDAINYLMSGDELVSAFAGVRRNLGDAGVLVFDANTLHAYRAGYSPLQVTQSEDRVIVTHAAGAAHLSAGGRADARFEVLARHSDGRWRREHSVHHQRHHPREIVEAALGAAGLYVAAVYGVRWDGSTAEGFDEHLNSKALYIARCHAPKEEGR
jgi:SAM-dependent methyltransferase